MTKVKMVLYLSDSGEITHTDSEIPWGLEDYTSLTKGKRRAFIRRLSLDFKEAIEEVLEETECEEECDND